MGGRTGEAEVFDVAEEEEWPVERGDGHGETTVEEEDQLEDGFVQDLWLHDGLGMISSVRLIEEEEADP